MEDLEKIEAIDNTGAEGTTEVGIGTLYDTNKMLVRDKLNALVEEQLEEKWNLVYDYFNKLYTAGNTYFMLLCKEKSDYTLFACTSSEEDAIEQATSILMKECLVNRGEIRSIEETEDGAIEIWLYIAEEDVAAVYYLFPYDNGVIEV